MLQDYIHAVEDAEARRDRLTRQIEEMLPSRLLAPVVAASVIQIAVSSPARCSFASIIAARRSVLTRSPDFIGISEGATTIQPCPQLVSNRCSP